MVRRSFAIVTVVSVGALLVACSDEKSTSSPTTAPSGVEACPAATPLLLVDLIDDAIAAVEAELGGAQEYFEINASAVAVNVIVATSAASAAVPYRFVGSELTSGEAQPAEGETFAAAAVEIDENMVLSCVANELPDSKIELFEILGTAAGIPRYSVFVTSAAGGQLVVGVTGLGQVLEVVSL
jgi:hypothetical protein